MASNQTVVFNNPSSITQLQYVNGTNVYFDTVANAANMLSYEANYLACTVGTTNGTDAFGRSAKSVAVLAGNAYTDQEVFVATGACTSKGDPWTQDVFMSLASSAKFFNTFMVLKGLEERLINLADTVGSYLPDWNTGIYYYYLSGTCTGAYGTSTTAPNWAAYTGARGTGALTEITIAHCLSLNVGFAYVGPGQSPISLQNAFIAPTNPATPTDWAVINSLKDAYFANQRGCQLYATGFVASQVHADPNALVSVTISSYSPYFPFNTGADTRRFMTGANSDDLASCLKCIKNGTIPMMWKVGSNTINAYSNINQQKAIYSGLPYSLIGACLSVAVKRAGYVSLLDYFQQKILNPMGITSNDYYLAQYTPRVSGAIISEQSARRTAQMSSGTVWYGNYLRDNSLYEAGLAYQASSGATCIAFNSVYWASQAPADIIINSSGNTYYDDPLGWNLGSNINTNFRTWKKSMKLFVNRGNYNGQQLVARSLINWSRNNCAAPGSYFALYSGIPNVNGPLTRWVAMQCLNFTGRDDVSDIQLTSFEYPGLGTLGMLQNVSDSVYYWSGSLGTVFMVDEDTGYYILQCNNCTTWTNNAKGLSATTPYTYLKQV